MNTPTGFTDYISPEEIEVHKQRAERQRQIRRDWLIWLVISLVLLALFVPVG